MAECKMNLIDIPILNISSSIEPLVKRGSFVLKRYTKCGSNYIFASTHLSKSLGIQGYDFYSTRD
jgi:hypothetical protein